ncbi:MAG: pitrilysin family protein [Syntrophorhabdales bacterium]|jgi:predicted Zn-dependent peptidase
MYQKTVLDNGIRVVTESLPYFPTVSFGVWWKTGSRHENEENSGISHFIEHMLFKGTERRTAHDIAREIDAVGGVLNAFTGKEYTCLYARVLRQDMDLALDVLADMYKHSTFNEEDIEREKHVVIQEIKMIEDSPEEWIFDLFTADYYKGDPLGLPVLGVEETVGRLTRDGLIDHFRTHHSPRNMVITCVGRIDHATLVKKVDALFSGAQDGGFQPPLAKKPEGFPGLYVYEKDLEHIYLCLGAGGVSQTDTRRYALYALNAIVGGSMSSHLFQEIREKRGLVYNIFSYVNCYHDVGNFGISTSSSEESLEEVIALIRDETAQLKAKGITPGELSFSKEHIKGNFFISLEGSEARMGRLAKNEIYFDRYVPVKETLKQIDGVHIPEVHEMSGLVFGEPREMALAVLGKVDRGTIERLWKS